jgi:hypothetical protein
MHRNMRSNKERRESGSLWISSAVHDEFRFFFREKFKFGRRLRSLF